MAKEKRYWVGEDERWPTLILREAPEGAGHALPRELVRRFKRAKKAFDEAEQAIIKHLDAESWFGR